MPTSSPHSSPLLSDVASRAVNLARGAVSLLSILATLAGCAPEPAAAPPSPTRATLAPPPASLTSATPSPLLPASPSMTPTETPIATATLGPDDWQHLPILPGVSETARRIYSHGLELGTNAAAFSKIGDCESTPAWFLGDFDENPPRYRLGDYQYLQDVIAAFGGSFERTSLAVGRGFNASSVLTALWADPNQCPPGDSPLACEIRLHRPSIAFVMLGTNDIYRQDGFEGQMRQILDYLIEQGVVPILSTKGDNLEGDGSLNATIARLALEYDIPLWNFWLALQPLPDHGLQEDGAHITWGYNHFDDPAALRRGWPIRNLTALQALDVVWRDLSATPAAD